MFNYNIKILPNDAIYVYLYGSKKSKYSVLRFVNFENQKTAWWVRIRHKYPIVVADDTIRLSHPKDTDIHNSL